MNNSIKPLSPFVLFCQKVIPLAFDESMSYYECLCALYAYLKDTVVPAVNNNAEALEEVQTAMTTLQEYVDNYFDNLDIQTEVNNKLDEMADGGELASIIAQYLQAQFIYGFDTIADMKAADTLASGNICRVLGKTNYVTGDGAFYRVRSLTVYDVPDNDEIVSLTNYPSLVAEKITDYYYNSLSSSLTSNVNRIDGTLNLLTNKKYIFIGDSYAEGYSPDGNTTSWVNLVVSKLNISDYTLKSYGGTGFVNTVDGKNFLTLLNEIADDNEVTDIVVCGGYNDKTSFANVYTAMSNFKASANSKFPNATIHVGAIGWSQIASNLYNLARTVRVYNYSAKKLGLHYLNNCEYSLHEYGLCFSSDSFHPNQYGQNKIADNISEALQYGSCNVIGSYENIHITNINSVVTETISSSLGSTLNNGLIEVSTQGSADVNFSTPQAFSGRSGLSIRLFDIDLSGTYCSYIIGNTYSYNCVNFPIIIKTSANVYYNTTGYLKITNGSVYLEIKGMINDDRNNYLSFNISQVQILSNFTFTCDGLMC